MDAMTTSKSSSNAPKTNAALDAGKAKTSDIQGDKANDGQTTGTTAAGGMNVEAGPTATSAAAWPTAGEEGDLGKAQTHADPRGQDADQADADRLPDTTSRELKVGDKIMVLTGDGRTEALGLITSIHSPDPAEVDTVVFSGEGAVGRGSVYLYDSREDAQAAREARGEAGWLLS